MRTAHTDIENAITHLQKDSVLKPLIDKHGVWKPEKTKTLFEALVGEIINQQLSDKASKTIRNKFINYFNNRFPNPQMVINTKDKDLRAVGISWAKVSYIKNVALYLLQSNMTIEILSTKDSEYVRKELTSIKGIGSWTVDMLLIFTLNHLDILPVGDLGIKNAMKKLYNKKDLTIHEMETIADSWRPYRSVASWYLWRSLS